MFCIKILNQQKYRCLYLDILERRLQVFRAGIVAVSPNIGNSTHVYHKAGCYLLEW